MLQKPTQHMEIMMMHAFLVGLGCSLEVIFRVYVLIGAKKTKRQGTDSEDKGASKNVALDRALGIACQMLGV